MVITWDLGLKTAERVLTKGTETIKNMQTLKPRNMEGDE